MIEVNFRVKFNDTGLAIFYTENLVFKVMLWGFSTSHASLKRRNMTLKCPILSLCEKYKYSKTRMENRFFKKKKWLCRNGHSDVVTSPITKRALREYIQGQFWNLRLV